MADEAKVPVAIRITRPYDNEDVFLARELETLTKTSIVLLGAQPRPQGVVLRFELVLASGAPLVRGEGRVVGYKENVLESLPGLMLRFTRLDSKSKALVDRAAALREARARGSAPPPPSMPLSMPPSQPTPPTAPSSGSLDLEATKAEAPRSKSQRPPPPPPVPVAPRSVPPPPRAPLPPKPRSAPPPPPIAASPPAPPSSGIDLEATKAEAPRAKSERPPAPPPSSLREPMPSSSDRDSLLGRLRARVKTLDEDRVQSILERGKRR